MFESEFGPGQNSFLYVTLFSLLLQRSSVILPPTFSEELSIFSNGLISHWK
jgi:hypothetical protein